MAKEKVKATKLVVGLPFGIGQLELEPDVVQQKAAWELYVEMATRIAIHPLESEEGHIREALASLYSIFDKTREILRQAGPSVAQGPNSFGPIAIEILNKGLRPFLSKWHPVFTAYEQQRTPETSIYDHESAWEKAPEFRQDLNLLHEQMTVYAQALAQIAGIERDE